MIVKTFAEGPVAANAHLLIDEKSGDAALVDCGVCSPSLLEALTDSRIRNFRYILLTHGHFDHINGVPVLKKHYPDTPAAIHQADEKCLRDDLLSLGRGFGFPAQEACNADIFLYDNEELPFGEGVLRVLHTPGHTKGGVTFQADGCLFTGDTLFYSSVGRTDFPGGSFDELKASVRKLYALGGDFTVYPGHGRNTTLEYERKNNNFVRWEEPCN